MSTLSVESRRVRLGSFAALASAVSYGAGSVVSSKIVSDFASPMVVSAFSLAFGTVIMAALFNRQAYDDMVRAPRAAWLYMALAGVTGAWGVAFFNLALTDAPVVLVAPVSGAYPLVSILLAYVFLKKLERVSMRTLLGAVLVVAGVALVALGR
jgi:drug/metabolite transporter (DMT)-like permease